MSDDPTHGPFWTEIETPAKVEEYLERVNAKIIGLAQEIMRDGSPAKVLPRGSFDLESFIEFVREWEVYYTTTKASFAAIWLNQSTTMDELDEWYRREIRWREQARAAGFAATEDTSPPPFRKGSLLDDETSDLLTGAFVVAGLFAAGSLVKAVKS